MTIGNTNERRGRAASRLWLASGVSVISLAVLLSAAPVMAQSTVGEVIVTARKKAEKIQDVPEAITAFSAKDLTAAGVQDLRDVTLLTPGLTFTTGAGANYFSKPIIRGQTDLGGGENNVPVFFDGVFISNTAAVDFGLIDLDRIEVIKGPVSATYGRSAYAGAINYISQKPSNDLRGFAEITGGDYGKFNIRGGVSGPIIEDVLKGGISASYDKFLGTYHDDVTGQNAGGYKKQDVLANLDFTPNSHLEIRPVFYYGDDIFENAPTVFGPANCSVGLGFGYSQSFCGKVPSGGTFQGPNIASGGQYGQTGNTRRVTLTNVQIKVSYDWGTISSLTGYNEFHTNQYSEFDQQDFGTPIPTYYLPAGATVGTFGPPGTATGNTVLSPLHFGYTDRNHDFSEELRYSSPQNQPVRFSLGAYYADSYHYEDLNLARGTCNVPAGQYIADPFAVPCGVTKSPQHSAYEQTDKIYSEFASLDWDIAKGFSFSTELRNNSTKSTYTDLYAIFDPNPYGCEGYSISCASTPNPIGPNSLSGTWNSVTSRTSLNYKFTPDVMVYASAANGEKAGGFNNNTAHPTYLPETNWTYEAGVKSTFLDHRLLIDADVYHIDAANYQIYGPPPGASLPGGFITTNYGGLATNGFEISSVLKVTDNVNWTVGFAYTDPKFKSNAYDFGDVTLCSGIPSCAGRIVTVGPNQAVRLNGLHPPYESDETFNTALDFNFPVFDSWNWTSRIDYRYESKQYYQYPIDTGYFGPRNIVNLRTSLEKGPYKITAYIRNLTDDKTPVTVQDAAVTSANNFEAGYFPVAVLPEGRNFGVTLTYKFGK